MNIFLHFQKIKKNSQLKKALGLLGLFVFSFLIFSHISVAAEAGKHIGYQGQLLNTSGTPQSGTYTMDFDFYDALSGGSQQGSTITKSVTVSNGYFSVDFSESDLSGIIFNQDLWMELTVSGTTLSPRSPVNSVPYSNVAFGVIYGSGAPALSNPADGALYFDTVGNALYVYDGSSWATVGGGVSNHNDLTGLQGGDTDEYYHLNFDDYSDLTAPEAQLSALMTDGSPTFDGLTSVSAINIANALYFDNGSGSGLVGFDSSNQNTILTLAGSNSGSSSDGATIRLLGVSAEYEGGDFGGLNLYAGDDGWIRNFTSNTERLAIDPNGNVGINTVNYKGVHGYLPSGNKLTVFGNIGNIFDETRQGEDITQVGGTYSNLDSINGMAMQGQSAFVIDPAFAQLVAIDTTIDSSGNNAPTELGRVDFNGSTGTVVKFSGKYAYVGSNGGDIQVYDISNLSDMSFVASLQPANFDHVYDLEIRGRYLYALGQDVDNTSHISVIDITNPSELTEVSNTYGQTDFAIDMTIQGDYLYIIDNGNDFLAVYNISNPVSPTYIALTTLDGTLLKSVISGNYLYYISSEGYFGVVNIVDKNNPTELTFFGLNGNIPYDMVLAGRYIYVTTDDARMKVIDIKNPNDAFVVKNIELPFTAKNISVQGKKIILSGGQFVAVFDASGIETSNALVHSLEAGSLDVQNDLHINGNVTTNGALNVGSGGINSNGDVAVGGMLTLGKEIYLDGTAGTSGQVLTSQGAGFAPIWADASGGGSGIQFNSNSSITQVGNTLVSASGITSIAMQGSYVYVADQGTDQLRVVDTTEDPSGSNGPVELSAPTLNDQVGVVKVAGKYAYVGGNTGYVQIVDVSNPSNPIQVGETNPTGDSDYIYDIEINGHYLYGLTHENDNSYYVVVLDISNPTVPEFKTHFSLDSLMVDMVIQGKFMYVISQVSNNFYTLDISDPLNINSFGGSTLSSTVQKIGVSDRFAYAVSDNGDFQVIDTRDKGIGNVLGTVSVTNIVTDMFVTGRYVYLANSNNSVEIIDVQDPRTPSLVNTIGLSFRPYGIVVQGKKIVVAGEGSVAVYDMSGFESSSALIHSLEVGTLAIGNNLSVDGNITTNGALNVGNGGIISNGDVAIKGGLTLSGPLVVDGTAGSAGQVLMSAGSGSQPAWTTISGGGSSSLDAITDAVGTATLTNANYLQTWNWSLTSTTNALRIGETSASSGTGYLLNLGTIASSTAKPLQVLARASAIIDTTATGDLTFGSTTNNTAITLQSGTGTIGIGTDANAKTINIGGTSANTINVGNTQTGGSIKLGNAMTTGTIRIGGTGNHTGNIIIGDGGGDQYLSFGNGSGNKTIDFGTNSGTGITSIYSGTGGMVLSASSGSGNITMGDTTGSGIVSIQSGSGAINIGTSAVGKTITIGNSASTSSLVLNAGTGALNVGTNAVAHAITIGNTTTSTGVNINTGSAGSTITTTNAVFTVATGTGTLTLSGDATANTLNIGTGAGVKTVTLGSTNSTSTLTLESGTGGITIGTGAFAKTVTIGSQTGISAVTIQSGSGAINLGTNSIAHTVTIGNTTGATAVNINAGTGGSAYTTTNSNFTLTTGTGSILIGNDSNTQNIFIGSSTGVKSLTLNSSTGTINISTDSSANAINIGTGAAAKTITIGSTSGSVALAASSAVTIQGSGTTCSIGNGTGTTSCTSDGRLKENVTDLDDETLTKVLALRPVLFNWNSISGHDQSIAHIGLIAQEVQDQFSDAVHAVYHSDALNDDVLGVDYGYLVVPTIKALQEQQALLGDIATIEGMTTLVTDIQNEIARDPVLVINEKINSETKFLTDFVGARVTAIRGYFDEIFAKKATLDEVCLKDADGVSCYTRSQLDSVINNANTPVAPIETPVDTNTPTENPTETTPTPTDTPAEVSPENPVDTSVSNTEEATQSTETTPPSETI